MEVSIEIPQTGGIATSAEIVDTHLDVLSMMFTVSVGLFNAGGDKLQVLSVDKKLETFPIPSPEEQWKIVKPTIEAYQTEHPAPKAPSPTPTQEAQTPAQ